MLPACLPATRLPLPAPALSYDERNNNNDNNNNDDDDDDDDENKRNYRPRKNKTHAKRRTNRKYKNRLPEDLARKVGEANAAFADEDYGLAIELLAEVSSRCPELAEPRITMGTVYELMGNPVQAVCCFGDAARRLCEGYLWSLRDAAEMFARAAGVAKGAYDEGGVHWL